MDQHTDSRGEHRSVDDDAVSAVEAEMMNQCDGCNARKPLVGEMHRMGGGAYSDWMFCQREKYVGTGRMEKE
jgi:hypothetical protein